MPQYSTRATHTTVMLFLSTQVSDKERKPVLVLCTVTEAMLSNMKNVEAKYD